MHELLDAKSSRPTAETTPNDLKLDHSKYASDLEEADISEDSKRELLETLWDIMRMFVELGYSVDLREVALTEIFNSAARADEGKSE